MLKVCHMRATKSALILAAFIGIVLLSGRALAQQSGFYLGGSLGQATFPEFCTGSALTCDDTDTGWKIFGGYQFIPYLGIEASYIDWGTIGGTVAGTPPRDVPLSQTSMGLALVASLPLGERFSVFGKLGRARVKQETPASLSGNFERKSTDTLRGLGAKFAFAPRWSARVEWEETKDIEAHMISIGVEFRF